MDVLLTDAAELIRDKTLILIKTAATEYEIPTKTLYLWIKQGELHTVRLKPHYTYIYREELENRLTMYTPRPGRRQVKLDFENA